MNTTLQRWGNSQGVRIPKSILEPLGMDIGTRLHIELSDDRSRITISPVLDTRPVRGRHRIEDLMAASSSNAFQGECDWGAPRGKEVW